MEGDRKQGGEERAKDIEIGRRKRRGNAHITGEIRHTGRRRSKSMKDAGGKGANISRGK